LSDLYKFIFGRGMVTKQIHGNTVHPDQFVYHPGHFRES
jgi:hypothetical protein